MSREIRRILVRAPNWLGDVVMTTPGLRALREAYPNATIVVLVHAPYVRLLEGSAAFDALWSFDAHRRGDWWRAAMRIRSFDFDLGLAIPESVSSALMMRLGGVRRVVGFERDPLRRMLLHSVVPAPKAWGKRRLVAKERYVLRLMAAVGATHDDESLDLAVQTRDVSGLRDLLGALSGPAARPSPDAAISPATALSAAAALSPVVVAPGSAYGDAKCWPVRSFAALADALIERGECVVLSGSAAERPRIDAVKAAMRRSALDLGGRVDLGILKALLREAKLFIGNDSGGRHVATAVGTPSVVFFGPTSVAKTDANLDPVTVLQSEHACRPCYLRDCPIDHRCLESISVAEALSVAEAHLPGAEPRALARESRVGGRG